MKFSGYFVQEVEIICPWSEGRGGGGGGEGHRLK